MFAFSGILDVSAMIRGRLATSLVLAALLLPALISSLDDIDDDGIYSQYAHECANDYLMCLLLLAAALLFSFGKTDGLQNVTVQVGSTAYLHCPVIHLGQREVILIYGFLRKYYTCLLFDSCPGYVAMTGTYLATAPACSPRTTASSWCPIPRWQAKRNNSTLAVKIGR